MKNAKSKRLPTRNGICQAVPTQHLPSILWTYWWGLRKHQIAYKACAQDTNKSAGEEGGRGNVYQGALVSTAFKDDSVPIKIHLTAVELKRRPHPTRGTQKAGPRTTHSPSPLTTSSLQSSLLVWGWTERGGKNTAEQGEKSSFH